MVIGIDKVTNTEQIQSSANFFFKEVDLKVYEHVIDALRGCEAVIHLAAIASPKPDYAVNAHNKYNLRLSILFSKLLLTFDVYKQCRDILECFARRGTGDKRIVLADG